MMRQSATLNTPKRKKPFILDNKDYIHHRDTLYKYAASKCTRGSIAGPGDVEKRELYFYAMAKPYQEVFADCHADCNSVTMADMTTILMAAFALPG